MQRTLKCGGCARTTTLPFGYAPADGDIITCGVCSTRYVVHLCNHSQGLSGLQSALASVAREELLTIVVGGVTRACPTCGVLYKIGDVVEKVDPKAGVTIKEAAIGLGLIALLVGSLVGSNKRRR